MWHGLEISHLLARHVLNNQCKTKYAMPCWFTWTPSRVGAHFQYYVFFNNYILLDTIKIEHYGLIQTRCFSETMSMFIVRRWMRSWPGRASPCLDNRDRVQHCKMPPATQKNTNTNKRDLKINWSGFISAQQIQHVQRRLDTRMAIRVVFLWFHIRN